MMKKLVLFCLAAALPAATAFAQGMGPMGGGTPPDPQAMIQMRVNMLANRLGLSDSQKTQATTIFTDAYTAGQDIHTNLQTNQQSLNDAIKKNDKAAIDTLATTAGTLHGQLIAINSKAEANFYGILTPDQQAKFDKMPHFGQGGPGMGMGGGMGMRRGGGRQQ